MAQRLKTDWTLFLTIVAMVCFGIVMVYSASSIMAEVKYGSSYYFIVRQAAYAIAAFLMLMYCKRLDYRRFEAPAWAFAPLGLTLALLLLVYFLDARRHRWLSFSSISLQPSELAKPALIIFLAYFVAQRLGSINSRHTIGPAVVAVAVLAATVVGPDFGTAVVLVLTAAIVFFVAGLQRKYVIVAATAALGLGLLAVASKPYRVARVISYVDPGFKLLEQFDTGGRLRGYLDRSQTARDPSYQPRQSRIAVGAGGLLGMGLMQGRQKLLYLPEAHTDYIYAVVGEELGLWGAAAVLFGFLIILWRGLRLFFLAPDPFGQYLALGITVSVVLQAFINMSVVLDMAPTKGIPLPMISYGGSSLLSTLTSLGLLLSVSEHAG